MDAGNHLLLFFESFCIAVQSYSIYVVTKGVLSHWLSLLITGSVFYGALSYFSLKRPPSEALDLILGSKWGSYGAESAGDESAKGAVKVIGHRACGLDAPENSISALKRMCEKGVPMVEFDVLLTADDVPIVFHDSNVNRMTDVNKEVSEMKFNEIKKLDISSKYVFRENFPNERIPTLKEFVTYCISKKVKMFIDLKGNNKKIVKVINDLFKEYPQLYNLAIVTSFDPILIYQIRANDLKIVCSLCWRPYYYSHGDYDGVDGPKNPRSSNVLITLCHRFLNVFHKWFLWSFGYYLVGISVVLLAKDSVTREEIRYWNKRGIRLIAWCVNLPSEKQYYDNNLKITYMTDTVINS